MSTTKKMTQREFYALVLAAESIDPAARDYAAQKLDALEQPQKKIQDDDKPLRAEIVTLMTSSGLTAKMVAEACGITSSKASTVLRRMVADGLLRAEDYKQPKMHSCKIYFDVSNVEEDKAALDAPAEVDFN